MPPSTPLGNYNVTLTGTTTTKIVRTFKRILIVPANVTIPQFDNSEFPYEIADGELSFCSQPTRQLLAQVRTFRNPDPVADDMTRDAVRFCILDRICGTVLTLEQD